MRRLIPPVTPMDANAVPFAHELHTRGYIAQGEPVAPDRLVRRRKASNPKTKRTPARGLAPDPTHPLWPVVKVGGRPRSGGGGE